MGRRTLLLIASILIAAVGTALIGLYVRGADNRAQETEGRVSVLVADATIPAGADLETALSSMRLASVPAWMTTDGYPNPSAFANIRKALKGQVVKEAIHPDQVVLASMFGTADAAATTEIKNARALTVQLTDPGRVIGLLAPGSHVTIYLIPTDTKPDLSSAQHITRTKTGQLILDPAVKLPVILPDALVMRVGNTRSTGTGGTNEARPDDVPRTIITLDLTEDGADKVVAAQAFGDLYFAVHKVS
ncbi:MAG TPA: RcpC/CpaB family pilus assembly protein [Kineosporiaceae bacterium]|nr:RcpC/CpaB family pilus assembly protein [Kineosporiaceae bacterium]